MNTMQTPSASETKTLKLVHAKPRLFQAVRQGDVIVQRRRTSDLPANCTLRQDRCLAVGTRGSHTVSEPADLLDAPDKTMWIVSPGEFTLLHPDGHDHIRLPGGTYKAWGQVEFPSSVHSPKRVLD